MDTTRYKRIYQAATMQPKYLPSGFLVLVLLVVLNDRWCDGRLALFMECVWRAGLHRSGQSLQVPDLLLPLACGVTAAAGLLWLFFSHTGTHLREKQFFQLLSLNVPAAFLCKMGFKQLFGRATPRFWLDHPDVYGFHWLHGGNAYGSFPSGHMAVFTAMILPLWRFYPRYRPLYVSFLLLLASAMIITDYHFLSDVLAGAYLGLAVDCVVHWSLTSARVPVRT